MESLKEFISRDKTGISQLLVEVTTDIINFRLNTKLKFIDNIEMMLDEKDTYTMSLYRDTLSEKAVSYNWSGSELMSISYWDDYAGSPMKPTKDILFKEHVDVSNIKPTLNAIFDRLLSCKEDKKLLEHVDITDGNILVEAETEDDNADFFNALRAVSAQRQQKAAAKAAAKSNDAGKRAAAAGSAVHFADPDYVFDDLEKSVKSLCAGSGFNAVLVAGPGGTGKSYHVEKALIDSGMKPNIDFVKYKVRMTPPQIYLSLLKNYDKIIIFDDCDEALINKTSANIFKAALDTTEHRFVSWYKTDTLDTTGLPNEVIQGLVANDKKQRLPSTFEFKGACIFITNLAVSKIESALLTRCDVIDVTLRREDIGKIIKNQLSNIKIPAHIRATGETVNIGTDDKLKEEVLEFLLSPEYQEHMQKHNMPLNFRLFQRAYTFARNDYDSWKRRMFNVYY